MEVNDILSVQLIRHLDGANFRVFAQFLGDHRFKECQVARMMASHKAVE